MATIDLPQEDGRLVRFTTRQPRGFAAPTGPFNRVAYSAGHVVADPLADCDPWHDIRIDWDRTIAYRRYLWSLGLGVAEAMDTAQRGMALDWPNAKELVRRSLDAARDVPGALIASGAGTDQLDPADARSLDDVIRAYEEQCEAIEAMGGRLILMASRALARVARTPADYAAVYGRILSGVREKVILHWLGDMFDPALKGYWGSEDYYEAMNLTVSIIVDNIEKVDGIKISLLDKHKEIELRRRLPEGVRMYTGDDFNYTEMIVGDGEAPGQHSHALLGIFDPIAPAASAALDCLRRGDLDEYHAILRPTMPLSRHIFQEPTYYYKTGVVFMAYLNGHQDHFAMLGGQQSARSLLHLVQLFRLSDAASLLRDPDLAAHRMKAVLAVNGLA